MRRLPTMLASASAAALTTLAVTVAVPAIAEDANGENQLAACLRDHGLEGAPEGAALKPWLGERMERGDGTAKRALEACMPEPAIVKPAPSVQQLRSCLRDHGVDVPGGDAVALKRWLLEHGDDARHRDAMKACDMAPVPKLGVGEACDTERATERSDADLNDVSD